MQREGAAVDPQVREVVVFLEIVERIGAQPLGLRRIEPAIAIRVVLLDHERAEQLVECLAMAQGDEAAVLEHEDGDARDPDVRVRHSRIGPPDQAKERGKQHRCSEQSAHRIVPCGSDTRRNLAERDHQKQNVERHVAGKAPIYGALNRRRHVGPPPRARLWVTTGPSKPAYGWSALPPTAVEIQPNVRSEPDSDRAGNRLERAEFSHKQPSAVAEEVKYWAAHDAAREAGEDRRDDRAPRPYVIVELVRVAVAHLVR
jgi:hypothetical protein